MSIGCQENVKRLSVGVLDDDDEDDDDDDYDDDDGDDDDDAVCGVSAPRVVQSGCARTLCAVIVRNRACTRPKG